MKKQTKRTRDMLRKDKTVVLDEFLSAHYTLTTNFRYES